MTTRVGMLTIGQAPRPDLVAPFARRCPDVELVEAGALDGLGAATLPHAQVGAYPLTTRLVDGSPVTLDESVLVPFVRTALARLEAGEVVATLLLCAAPFAAVRGTRPLVRPFELAVRVLRTTGARRIGVVVPVEEQRHPATRKFAAAGFDATVWVAPLRTAGDRLPGWLGDEADAASPVDHVVLDYVGNDPDDVARIRDRIAVPLIDLGLLAAETLAATL
jgi:protein AroM